MYDLEFILSHKINYFLIFLWTLMPICLTCTIIWQIWSYFNNWNHSNWRFWLMIGMFVFALGNIIIWAIWVVVHKEGYGFVQVIIKYIYFLMCIKFQKYLISKHCIFLEIDVCV